MRAEAVLHTLTEDGGVPVRADQGLRKSPGS